MMIVSHKGESASVLKPAEPSPAFGVITGWQEFDAVPPEVLRDWLVESIGTIEAAVADLAQRSDEIGEARDSDKGQAYGVMMNGLDFLDRSEKAWSMLQEPVSDEVAAAFTEGLRLGLLYERLMSHARDDFRRKYVKDEVLRNARAGKSDVSAERRGQAQAALARAQKDFPQLTLTSQKKRAAADIGISLRQLNRYLKASEK